MSQGPQRCGQGTGRRLGLWDCQQSGPGDHRVRGSEDSWQLSGQSQASPPPPAPDLGVCSLPCYPSGGERNPEVGRSLGLRVPSWAWVCSTFCSLGAAAGVHLTAVVAEARTHLWSTPPTKSPLPCPVVNHQAPPWALPGPWGDEAVWVTPGTPHAAGSGTVVGLPREVCVSPETWRVMEDPLLDRRGLDTGVDSKEPRAPACSAGPDPPQDRLLLGGSGR
ncbi:Hypothetical predicted protein [Marmota monax]|uniref:Uncharacterized protein n=1 Tax=Marmota monax TaxID=9995 RepID=A0A5E4AQ32_MARMO|nr:Hypothetical predicted protein [Marmota monax]